MSQNSNQGPSLAVQAAQEACKRMALKSASVGAWPVSLVFIGIGAAIGLCAEKKQKKN